VPERQGELRAQLALAVPLAAQQMGLVLLGLVDTAMLGHYSSAALAGGGLGNSLVFLISCVGMGIVMGLDTLVPQAIGAGRAADTRWLLFDGLAVAVRVGLVLSVLVALSPLLLGVSGISEEITREADVFIWVRSPGVVLFLVQVTLRVFLQAHGVTRPLIVAVIVANLVNLLFVWLFVFGVPAIGLPAMGSGGAALATTVVQIATVVVYAMAARTVLAGIERGPRPPRATARILRVGLPVGLYLGAEVGVFAFANVIAARLGKLPGDGYQVALNLASMTFAAAVGVGAAASVRVGLAVGAGDHRLARARGRTSLVVGALIMSTGVLTFLIFPAQLARLFTDDPEVVAAAVPMLRIAAVFQLSDGAQAIAAGALRGAGDTRATFYANVVGHYGVGLPVSLGLTFGIGMGANGLWWGLTAGLTATAAVLTLRFWRITSRPIARA
jgi:MATE family multidrug resistance protein